MILVCADNASEWTGPTGNNTYLLTGSVPTLIDAGVGKAGHIDAIAAALGDRSLTLLLITHGHADHESGVPALTAKWPALRARKAAPNPTHACEALRDGERLDAGDTTLLVIATPGHSPDHCCFFDEREGDLYCGDLVRAGGTVVIPASRGGDLAEYLSSLRRVRALGSRRLLAGHGPIIDDPGAIIDEYIRHRAERETQVLRALRAGCQTPDGIAAAIYESLAEALLPAAAESVLAHLIKLRNEGRVREEEGRWVARDR
jgi:glyoxylase-like metal-dependent hydrolase (beta-lactamase superfamily II)